MIYIDGCYGEGGGQILRTTLALSVITQQPITIENIRKNRPVQGLQAQHLTVVKAFEKICNAQVQGAEKNSTKLVFKPNKISGGDYIFDIGTAGSVTLLAQALLPILIKKHSKIKLIGGTHVNWSPSYDYFENVFVPALGKMNVSVTTNIQKYGFYPRGKGQITIETKECKIKPFDFLDCCPSDTMHGKIILSNLPEHVAQRERKTIGTEFDDIEKLEIKKVEAQSPGNCITLWKGLTGAGILGSIGVPAETVAKNVCAQLKQEKGFGVDVHLSDQIMIYMALAKAGKIYTREITGHARTNAHVIEQFKQFMDIKFNFEKHDNGYLISVE